MCGCGKSSTPRRGPTVTALGAQAVNRSTTNTPAQIRALGFQAVTPQSGARLDEERLRVEKLRREAIKKALHR